MVTNWWLKNIIDEFIVVCFFDGILGLEVHLSSKWSVFRCSMEVPQASLKWSKQNSSALGVLVYSKLLSCTIASHVTILARPSLHIAMKLHWALQAHGLRICPCLMRSGGLVLRIQIESSSLLMGVCYPVIVKRYNQPLTGDGIYKPMLGAITTLRLYIFFSLSFWLNLLLVFCTVSVVVFASRNHVWKPQVFFWFIASLRSSAHNRASPPRSKLTRWIIPAFIVPAQRTW